LVEHVVVVPVYNEESAVEAVLTDRAAGYRSMVIVDDGSGTALPRSDCWSAFAVVPRHPHAAELR
jgi:hypothetical protein